MSRNIRHRQRIRECLDSLGPLTVLELTGIMADRYRNAPTRHQLGNLLKKMPEVDNLGSIRQRYTQGRTSKVSLWGLKEGVN